MKEQLKAFINGNHTQQDRKEGQVRWDDDVKDDLRKMGVNNWKQKAQERKSWRGIIKQAKTHKELQS